MARLGIDFGTTNTVAVVHDRGMFTVVLHQAKTGAGTIVQDIFPSEILIDADGRSWFGLEAARRFAQIGPAPGCTFIPSLKRQLREYAEGKLAQVGGNGGSGTEGPGLAGLLTAFLSSLADSIRQSQMFAASEPLEAVITWPANANGAQRHITRRCFREAGFEVLDTLNEPTASAIELADCLTAGRGRKQEAAAPRAVAVFDLGGGTFDASVVWVEGDSFEVLTSSGIENLGGDDFDNLLLEMFLEKLGAAAAELGPLTRYSLLRQVRSQKESISTGAVRSLFLNPADFGLEGRPISLPVLAYEERVRPLLVPAIDRLREVMTTAATKRAGVADASLMTVYLVGGSSKLPLVARMVSEAFPGCGVVLTDKPFQSVAMGAAISATDRVQYRDVFARHFGLIRLRDHGQREVFDRIFPAGTPIPRRGEPAIEKTAWYHPAHNAGHLRYLECSDMDGDGMPAGSVRTWSDIVFPYDPAQPLASAAEPGEIVQTSRFAGEAVCEVYRCDADGVITVELRRPYRQETRCYEIYHD